MLGLLFIGCIYMSEFVDYLKEVFEQFGRIQCRKMFGGYGITQEMS